MTNLAHKIRDKIRELQSEVETELSEKRDEFQYRLERRKVIFEQEALALQREAKMGLIRYLRESRLLVVLTSPLIYSMILPIMICDLFVSVYQAICFPIYGIPKVKRREYVVMDRKYLAYLNIIEKMNCIYCEYANGVIAYVREIASRTEQYWCPIKHARKLKDPPARYYGYLEYGDSEALHKKWEAQRDKCRACEVPGKCTGKTEGER
ncbi:MAG TPA: hypothetical protein PK513_01945 [Alphaproteobacteria bacterium]|nr:hypothetical protein [Alphaproteobacteria bacterium]USO04735.1 MAG: hypothetical protein H6859_06080 [Rhodospirillales bacterium]HOO81246.1 hypothetical protein [Alphaproteobacteria bacterium]